MASTGSRLRLIDARPLHVARDSIRGGSHLRKLGRDARGLRDRGHVIPCEDIHGACYRRRRNLGF